MVVVLQAPLEAVTTITVPPLGFRVARVRKHTTLEIPLPLLNAFELIFCAFLRCVAQTPVSMDVMRFTNTITQTSGPGTCTNMRVRAPV